jgi:hypothetical protein
VQECGTCVSVCGCMNAVRVFVHARVCMNEVRQRQREREGLGPQTSDVSDRVLVQRVFGFIALGFRL